ncbi:MAG TPA: TonB-dependent receptor [Vicinamibacterales bacterium]
MSSIQKRWTAALVCVLVALAAPVFAAAGSVKGIVHDPQHRPVPGATVTIKARTADWQLTAVTDASGVFEFASVPPGDYTVTAVLQGFTAPSQSVTVLSDASPLLHFQLELSSLSQSVTVSAGAESARPDTMTPTTLVSRADIANTPGADRTNGLEAITAFVPGAYVAHDQLHVRGGHQVSWLVDGVPVPNTNIASNVGPQFDPKDVDYMEAQRGSYGADYGDRTYGVFNVVPRTGFERDNDAEIVASVGSFGQTNDQISVGGHTERFAYYASGNGNRSNLGLETPVAQVLHDREEGGGGFASFVFNANPSNQLRIVTSLRRDNYQIPNDPDAQAAGMNDNEHEVDGFVTASWVRTYSTYATLTVSPFYHYNLANYEGGPTDFPTSAGDRRRSEYGGAQATLEGGGTRNSYQAGFYGFHQGDDERFSVEFNDGSSPNFVDRESPAGHLLAFFAQDKFRAADWLTLTAGVRQTNFSGAVSEEATSPRIGASLQIPGGHLIVRGFYGRYYQAPPLATVAGPLIQFITAQDLGFVPLRGERDTEYQIGVTVPVAGWTFDADEFRTMATNFLDHDSVGNSNVFLPLTIAGARIRGIEFTARSPRSWRRVQVHVAYSHQHADGRGAVTGGLTDFEPPEDNAYFPLDHDQRDTLSAGVSGTLPHGIFAGANAYYGSGLPDDDTGSYLPSYATIDLTGGKQLRKDLSASINVLNAGNRHVLIDNSLTFGGVHFNNPREVYVELRYRFHY